MGKFGKVLGWIGTGAGALAAGILAIKTAREPSDEYDSTLEPLGTESTPTQPAAQPAPEMATVETPAAATGTETQG